MCRGQKSQLAIEQIIRRINPRAPPLWGVQYRAHKHQDDPGEGPSDLWEQPQLREDFEKSIEILETYPEVTDYLEPGSCSYQVRTIKDIHHAFERIISLTLENGFDLG